ncbi:hypothetical protein C8Q76DRAFT_747899 [Earliella scabrosa]|nr:hypothetical protein C8Q76DRAFT_747899 [Earliella scabrosa]
MAHTTSGGKMGEGLPCYAILGWLLVMPVAWSEPCSWIGTTPTLGNVSHSGSWAQSSSFSDSRSPLRESRNRSTGNIAEPLG